MYTYIYIPPDLVNHVKLFTVQLRRSTLWELVPNWYKRFPLDPND